MNSYTNVGIDPLKMPVRPASSRRPCRLSCCPLVGGLVPGERLRGQNGGMTDDPFEACWYRWERADSRHQEMVKVWNDYVARQPHDVELVHQGQGVHLIRVVETSPSRRLRRLRVAVQPAGILDYIIWAAAAYASGTLPPANEGVLQYPDLRRRGCMETQPLSHQGPARAPAATSQRDAAIRQRPGRELPRVDQPACPHRQASEAGRWRLLPRGAEPRVEFDRGRKATLQWGTGWYEGQWTDVARVPSSRGTTKPW